jgi:predicted MFS family arabinose efflux permease
MVSARRKFSTLAGMTNTAGMLGAASGAPVAVLVKDIGWRETVAWMGGAELVLAVLVFAVVRDRSKCDRHQAAPTSEKYPRNVRCVGNPQVWINAIYATTISLVFVAFGGLWGTSYIQKVYGFGHGCRRRHGSLLFLGGIAGSLFFGWIFRLSRETKTSDGAGRSRCAGQHGVPALSSRDPAAGFKLGLFLVGFFSSANIVSYAVARDLYPKLAGFSIGF